jgi:hypothetical protein
LVKRSFEPEECVLGTYDRVIGGAYRHAKRPGCACERGKGW